MTDIVGMVLAEVRKLLEEKTMYMIGDKAELMLLCKTTKNDHGHLVAPLGIDSMHESKIILKAISKNEDLREYKTSGWGFCTTFYITALGCRCHMCSSKDRYKHKLSIDNHISSKVIHKMACMTVSAYPGCCGMVNVVNSSNLGSYLIKYEYANVVYLLFMLLLKTVLEYTYVTTTCVSSTDVVRARNIGFSDIGAFRNVKTDNRVKIMGMDISNLSIDKILERTKQKK